MSVNVVKNGELLQIAGNAKGEYDVFTGTTAEVQQAIADGTIKEDMIVNITDDYDPKDIFDSELSETSENAVQNKIISKALLPLLSMFNTPEMHRNIFRGKNLGTSLKAEQLSNIRNGTFDDLYVGDYWVINGVTWRIVDINYWLNTGDTACTTPHLVVMPDTALYNAKMNDTNTTVGGYVGSKMYTENLENAKTLINAAFGAANILNYREYLTNAVTNGYPSAGAWYDSTVELPNEIMMYGSYVFTAAGDGSFVPNRYTIDKTQLALMKVYPRFINPARQTQWLRDVVSGAHFSFVGTNGLADYYGASAFIGVRPFFGIA